MVPHYPENPQFPNPRLPTAVVVAKTRWDEPPRMRHDVVGQLKRFSNVLYIEYFPAGRRSAKEGVLRSVDDRLIVYQISEKYRLHPRLYTNLPFLHASVNRKYAREIGGLAHQIGTHDGSRLLVNFVHDFPELVTAVRARWSCYVCVDEFPRMQRRSQKRNFLHAKFQEIYQQALENRLAAAVDLVLTPHTPIREKLTRHARRIEMFYHAHSLPDVPAILPPQSDGRIHVGFAGYINYRIIVDWLIHLVRDPRIVLHLIGPQSGMELDTLLSAGDVRCHGAVYGEQFIASLKEMNVLVMPYDPEITECHSLTTNSKTFQCIASGRPLVISNLPNYIKMPEGVIYKAEDAEDFRSKVIKAAVEDCDELRVLRRQVASENTWDKRGEQLWNHVKHLCPVPGSEDNEQSEAVNA